MYVVFVFKQKTAYEMRISDWSSDVCSSDLLLAQIADTCLQCHGALVRSIESGWRGRQRQRWQCGGRGCHLGFVRAGRRELRVEAQIELEFRLRRCRVAERALDQCIGIAGGALSRDVVMGNAIEPHAP